MKDRKFTTWARRAGAVPVAAASLVLTLSGCTSLLTPLGSEYYDCNRKENPASPYCHSFRSVTNGTNDAIPDSRYDATVRIEDVDRLAGIAPDHAPASAPASRPDGEPDIAQQHRPGAVAAAAPIRPGARPIAYGPSDGTPVRVAPLIQRTWIKRHVEEGDRLVGSTYLYKEVTKSHWEGFPDGPGTAESSRAAVKPHYPADDDSSGVRAAAGAASKGAAALVGRVKSSLSQPGLATPAGEVVAPPIDGASMPQ